MTNKVKLKNLINKIRKLIKLDRFEKKQIYGCMNDVIIYFKNSTIQNENTKIYSKFLINFLHLLANTIREYKIIEEDEEEYSEKFSVILSYFIDLEVKKFKSGSLEQLLAAKIISKCRILCDDIVTIRAVATYLARNEFHHIFNNGEIKASFLILFEKIMNSSASKINQPDFAYYHQIFITWLKLCADEDEMKTNVYDTAKALNLKIESLENGQIENVRQIIMDRETRCDIVQSDKNSQDEINDLFEECKNSKDLYSVKNISWFKKLKISSKSANATIDLTIDSEDSEIEMELLIPSVLIEIEDNQKEPKEKINSVPLRIIRKITPQETPRICIQERRTYITTSNDIVKPLSFAALRRRTIIANEADEILKVDRKRRKSAYPRLTSEKKETKKSKGKQKNISRRVEKLKIAENNSNLKKKLKLIRPCSVLLKKISKREISQFRKKQLEVSYFIEKFDVYASDTKKLEQNARKSIKPPKKAKVGRKKLEKKNVQPKKRRQESLKKLEFIDEISILEPNLKKQKATVDDENETIESYPDHTKPNMSLLQLLPNPKEAKLKPRIIKIKKSLEFSPQRQTSEEEESIPIVNWPIEQKSPLGSPWHNPRGTSYVNGNNFDAVSDNEQQVEAEVNTSLLEEILGTRANNYLSEVRASLTSSFSENSQSADELSLNETKTEHQKRDRNKSI